MKDCGDLQDKELRLCIIHNLSLYSYNSNQFKKVIHILEKEKITINDVLTIIFTNKNDRTDSFLEELIIRSLFDYKMFKISEDRVFKFLKMAKEIYPFIKESGRISHYRLRTKCGVFYDYKFNQLIDKFLDEI